MLGFVIITLCLDYAKLNPYYTIPTIFGGEPFSFFQIAEQDNKTTLILRMLLERISDN